MATATAMPPIPASKGSANRRRSRSSPRSNSRRASRPTTRKKNVISPLFTQWRRSSATAAPPRSIESVVSQSESYDDRSTFTHTSAATVAARRTAAPPVSVRRNSRSGVWTLRAHAVRPENGGAWVSVATVRWRRETGLASGLTSRRARTFSLALIGRGEVLLGPSADLFERRQQGTPGVGELVGDGDRRPLVDAAGGEPRVAQ